MPCSAARTSRTAVRASSLPGSGLRTTLTLSLIHIFIARVGGGAKESVVFDQAPYIEDSIHDLTVEGLLGLFFAVVVILIFLASVRSTIITAISIPLSLLIAMIGLWTGSYTLNILTLGALTVAIGRVVDDLSLIHI